jgi:hypothetical protein
MIPSLAGRRPVEAETGYQQGKKDSRMETEGAFE